MSLDPREGHLFGAHKHVPFVNKSDTHGWKPAEVSPHNCSECFSLREGHLFGAIRATFLVDERSLGLKLICLQFQECSLTNVLFMSVFMEGIFHICEST